MRPIVAAGSSGGVPPRAGPIRYSWAVPKLALPALALLLALAIAARLFAGDAVGGLHGIWELRVQRIIIGTLVGSSLGIAGVLLQSLLRNPLASPDLIGPTAGAGLAVMARAYVAHALGFATTGALSGAAANAPAALVGAVGVLALVYTLSQRRGLVEPISLVLMGVIISILCGAATMFLANLLGEEGFRVARWSIGALSEETSTATLVAVGAGVGLGLVAGMALAPAMDVAALSDDEARSSGLSLGRLRFYLFALAGMLTAGSVVLAGPVGFVGLVCPHLVRLLAGPSHRTLVLGSALAGAALIVGADALTKAINLGGGRMPIGILTALIGGPVFILLLRHEPDRTA